MMEEMKPFNEMNEYERKELKDAHDAAEAISRFTNRMGFAPKFFVHAMSQQHRTLQQAFTRCCLLWLVHLAGLEEGWYDLRNEASVKTAKRLLANEDKRYVACLPTI